MTVSKITIPASNPRTPKYTADPAASQASVLLLGYIVDLTEFLTFVSLHVRHVIKICVK